jgi:hypothetical protein
LTLRVSSLAIFCRRNETAIDLMIPYRRSDGVFSFILVQVKNYETISGDGVSAINDTNVDHMARNVIKIPPGELVIYLLMQVGHEKTPDSGTLFMNHKVKGLILQGISKDISLLLKTKRP